MADIFEYNSGSLFQALDPETNLAPVTDEDWVADLDETFKQVGDGRRGRLRRAVGHRHRRRHPLQQSRSTSSSACRCPRPGTSSWPTTRRSRPPASTRSSRPTATPGPRRSSCSPTTTTSQAANPDWAEEYTADQAKYATTPEALAGFQHLRGGQQGRLPQRGLRLGASYDDGLAAVASGKAAHYPMITFGVPARSGVAPGQRQRRRLLRHPRRRRQHQRRDPLVAVRSLHPDHDRGRQARGRQEVPGVPGLPGGLRGAGEAAPAGGPVRGQVLHAARRTSPRRSRTCRLRRRRHIHAGAGVPLARSRARHSSRSPSRSAQRHPLRRLTAPRSTTRT